MSRIVLEKVTLDFLAITINIWTLKADKRPSIALNHASSSLHDLLPPPTRRALAKLGQDLVTARRKRRFTVAMMVERMGVATNTYRRVEKGDPTVAMGAYAMALFVLGLGSALGDLVDPKRDEVGLQLDEERLPKRVRLKENSDFAAKRTLQIFLGNDRRPVGTLHYDQNGAREHAAFAYDETWLAAPDRFAIEPNLRLVAGRSSTTRLPMVRFFMQRLPTPNRTAGGDA